jgi:dTMP kinase
MFIVFEGIDGSGKTTQARLLVSNLMKMGINAIFTREPSDGTYGQQIRQAKERFTAVEEEKLFREDRKEHLEKIILPALNSGLSIVCDRYIYSSVAYQGARGLDYLKILEENLKFAPLPDITFILEVSAADGMQRIKQGRTSVTVFEIESELTRVGEIYTSLQDASIERISANAPIELVQAELLKRLIKRGFLS